MQPRKLVQEQPLLGGEANSRAVQHLLYKAVGFVGLKWPQVDINEAVIKRRSHEADVPTDVMQGLPGSHNEREDSRHMVHETPQPTQEVTGGGFVLQIDPN